MKLQDLKFYLIAILILSLFVQANPRSRFTELKKDFYDGYTALNLPELQIDYVNNLELIQVGDQLEKQQQFFEGMQSRWNAIDSNELSETDFLDYQIMGYEIGLNIERLSLEKKWNPRTTLKANKSIYAIPNGKDWYTYLLKRWVDESVTPEELFEFGILEIQKVKANMSRIQGASGLSDEAFKLHLKDAMFLIDDPKKVQLAFENTKKEVAINAPKMFPYLDQIPDVSIEKGTNAALAHVPAYYNNNTFYYNLFDTPFNKRQIGWFYVHEAIPGHHYQISLNNIVRRSEIQELFWYPGFIEGWGAYVEHLGAELGAYPDIYAEYGKWEWDLIRSVRVCIDIGINYKGWSDEKALTFWNSHIEDKKEIAEREISRMKRWPAQVITYKYGAAALLELLKEAKKQDDFDFKLFHKEVLQYGDIPISILLKTQKKC